MKWSTFAHGGAEGYVRRLLIKTTPVTLNYLYVLGSRYRDHSRNDLCSDYCCLYFMNGLVEAQEPREHFNTQSKFDSIEARVGKSVFGFIFWEITQQQPRVWIYSRLMAIGALPITWHSLLLAKCGCTISYTSVLTIGDYRRDVILYVKKENILNSPHNFFNVFFF